MVKSSVQLKKNINKSNEEKHLSSYPGTVAVMIFAKDNVLENPALLHNNFEYPIPVSSHTFTYRNKQYLFFKSVFDGYFGLIKKFKKISEKDFNNLYHELFSSFKLYKDLLTVWCDPYGYQLTHEQVNNLENQFKNARYSLVKLFNKIIPSLFSDIYNEFSLPERRKIRSSIINKGLDFIVDSYHKKYHNINIIGSKNNLLCEQIKIATHFDETLKSYQIENEDLENWKLYRTKPNNIEILFKDLMDIYKFDQETIIQLCEKNLGFEPLCDWFLKPSIDHNVDQHISCIGKFLNDMTFRNHLAGAAINEITAIHNDKIKNIDKIRMIHTAIQRRSINGTLGVYDAKRKESEIFYQYCLHPKKLNRQNLIYIQKKYNHLYEKIQPSATGINIIKEQHLMSYFK